MWKVVVIGVRKNQARHLRARLADDVVLVTVPSARSLKIRGLSADLVLCTRFISHKHGDHLKRVFDGRVAFCPGGIGLGPSSFARGFGKEVRVQFRNVEDAHGRMSAEALP